MNHLQKLGYILIGSVLTIAVMGTALAATGALTIEVNPINVQVNGQTFQPKDAKGNSVPVFSYNGTTYAPLRALAEAYGLEVGYDAEKNMATVKGDVAAPTTTPAPDTALSDDYSTWSAEEETAYQEFKGMWEVDDEKLPPVNGTLTRSFCDMRYTGVLETSAVIEKIKLIEGETVLKYVKRIRLESNIDSDDTTFAFSVDDDYIMRIDCTYGIFRFGYGSIIH